jgi:tetratricopeptide (TPR) repeat protein
MEAQQPEARREQFERRLLAEQATGYQLLRLVLRVRLCLAKTPHEPVAGEQARALLLEMEQAWGESVSRLAGFFAQSHTALRDYDLATKWLDRCLVDDPADWQALALRARVYYETGRHPDAVNAAVESLSLVYHQPFLQAMLGLSLQAMGLDRQAEEALRVALVQAPGMVAGHEALAGLYGGRLHDPERARQHHERAETLRKRAQELRALRQTETPSARAASPTRGGSRPLPPSHEGAADWPGVAPGEIVTVVAGLPRTGTSMMMQMLAAGGLPPLTDGKRTPDPDNPRGYLEFEPATRLRDDASWVPQAKGKAVKIVAQLLPYLPASAHCRIVFMHRDLREVIASQQAMLERQGKPRGALGPDELAEVLDRQAADVARAMAARPNARVLHIDYRDAVRQPAETAHRLNVFFGGLLREEAMVAAVDPALHRQKGEAA